LEITFSDIKIRDLFGNKKALACEFGDDLARKICCGLAMLAAGRSLADIPVALPIGLAAVDNQGRFCVSVGLSHHLLFQAVALEPAAPSVLADISRLRIIGLVTGPPPKEKQS
jgi:hypothetical protein